MATSIRSATPTRTCTPTWSSAGSSMAKTFGSRPRQAYQAGPAYPKGQPNASRRDAWPPEGGRPGSSLPFMQKQLLDENNIQLGILNPTGDNGASFQNREFGAGVASAMNHWVDGRVADRTAPERLHRRALRRRRRRGGRDRALGRRSALRPGADGDAAPPIRPARSGTGRSTRPPPRRACRSACTPSASAAIRSPAAAGRRSTSRTWSATPSRRSPS